MQKSVLREILAILGEVNDMTVATTCPDGSPHATVVSFASRGLRLYFGCAPDSRKAQNLGAGGHIAATVTAAYKDWGQIRGLSLTGRARRLDEMAEIDTVSELFLGKFPEVAQFVGEPSQSIRLYEVTPDLVCVLDYSKGFGHTERVAIRTADLAA